VTRTILAAALAAVLTAGGAAPARAAVDDHANALAALADVRAAVGEIVRIENGYEVGHAAYLRAAHRAMNALVGRRDDGYGRTYGDPGDGVGTLGHLDAMLDKAGTSLWTPAVQGAKANVLAAASNLQDALGEKEMENYQADLTHALANLALVVGRPADAGVLGGLSGALANTTLGVPAGAASVSGCGTPARGPAYGIVAGRLAYVALPRAAAAAKVPDGVSASRIVVHGDDVVLYAPVARDAASLCGRSSAMQSAHIARAPRIERARRLALTAPAVPFTAAQARSGALVYRKSCLQCHGADLQGTAGPAVAGREFLQNAQRNHWTLRDVRTTVFENMPFSDPGSLTPKQYADVMAFLLASSCYPAGTKPFPAAADPAFAKIKIGPVAGAKPANAKLGTCGVR
jgi:polar amino acid transport system substrate-binding protein